MRKIAVFLFSFIFALSLNASTKITFKAAKTASSYYQMAVQLGENVSKTSNDELSFTIEESQGSVQNIKESRKRAKNYLFSTPPGLLQSALLQKGQFEKDSPKDYEEIRSLFVMPYLTMHFVTEKSLNVKKIDDLKGKTILVGKGSYGANEGKRYIELFGLKNSVKVVEAELSAATNAMKNGQIDGFVTSGSFPAPNILELSSSVKLDIISFSDEEIEKTGKDKIVIPANTYKDVDYEVSTTTMPVGIYVVKMDEETAYKITKYFWESKPNLEKSNPWWSSISFENLKDLKVKLHKGALKYYDEIGIEVPKNLR